MQSSNKDFASAAREANHIVVTGYSRSGTTMFYHMLRRAVKGYEFMDEEVPAERFVGLDRKNRITKRPLDLFNLEQIHRNNRFGKQLSLIIMIRDIRSVLTSFHSAVPDDYFIAYDYQYFVNRATGENSYCNPGVIPIHEAIVKATQNAHFQKKVILKYEDLIASPNEQQAFLGRELGLEYSDSFENFHKQDIPAHLTRQLNELRAIDRNGIERWREPEHAQRIRSQFTRCPALFDILIQYGYEKDRSWFEPFKRGKSPRP
jgi:hypothetical protein